MLLMNVAIFSSTISSGVLLQTLLVCFVIAAAPVLDMGGNVASAAVGRQLPRFSYSSCQINSVDRRDNERDLCVCDPKPTE